MAPLLIQTTGLEEYAPGGKARIKVLNIGGPGAGKTRWASYFPAPIYADCERGLASVADRKVPFVNISSSQDMLDLLAMLKQECRQPASNRRFQTVVIDTLDAFQRKVKNEWMEKERKEVFTGWEAWGFLNSRMQLLMTRLLNLDMHVIVNVHFKDRKTKDDESGKESHELMLQLQGDLADTAFNDFDLVGWMGTYWEAVDGQRVQKRGLTFKATPDKPFLKDRLHVTPAWLEVSFSSSDYESLFEAINARVAEMSASEVIGEIEREIPDQPAPGGFVIPAGAAGSGPLPPQEPRDIPYSQMDKPSLNKLCRDRGITATADGSPIRGNTLKAELIAALEANDATPAAAPAPPGIPAGTTETPEPAADPAPASPPLEPAALPTEPDAPQPPSAPVQALQRVANAQRTRVGNTTTTGKAGVITVEEGQVDTATGELVADPAITEARAIETVEKVLGGEVIATQPAAPPPPPPPAVTATATAAEDWDCAVCNKPLKDEKQDFVKLSWIKYRQRLCEEHYLARKSGAK